EFCRFETLLGELVRARAIYAHIGQCCDPRQHEDSFWSKWHAFEIEHGNEETFLDMLRIKRSVQMLYATVNYIGTAAGALNMVASSTNQAPTSSTSSSTIVPGDAMETLEKEDQTTNDEEMDIDEQPVPEAVVRGKVF
ncbi:hypothetical protein DYB30_012332, partial [Aphanomyces astaci]